MGEKSGPNCRGLPQPPHSQKNPDPGVTLRDGSTGPQGSRARRTYIGDGPSAQLLDPTSGHAGTAEEQQAGQRAARAEHEVSPDEVPDIATLLYGPVACVERW